jgi:hypothetical protein
MLTSSPNVGSNANSHGTRLRPDPPGGVRSPDLHSLHND